MKGIVLFLTAIVLLTSHAAFSQERPAVIKLEDGTLLQGVNILNQEVVINSGYGVKTISFTLIKAVEIVSLKREGQTKLILKDGSVIENATLRLSKLNVDSQTLGRFEIPTGNILYIVWEDQNCPSVYKKQGCPSEK